MSSTPAAGSLRHRITLLARAAGQDAAGQPATTWDEIATVWADIRYPGGMETIKAGIDTATLKASIRIRYRTGVNAGMRVQHRADLYDVQAVLPDAVRREYLDLICQTVPA